MVSAAELVVMASEEAGFSNLLTVCIPCVAPPVKAVLIVITVIQLCITSAAGISGVQILIQGKTQLINIQQRNCLNKTAFLLIIREKDCRVIKYSSLCSINIVKTN